MKREGSAGLSDLGIGLALNDALNDDDVDPSARALMQKQARMLDLQMSNMRADAQVGRLKFLRERLHVAFELAVAAVIVLGLVVAGSMVWQASRAEGLVIEPFATPPDMAARGVTGTVLASRISDGLGEIEVVTRSLRASGAIRTTQPQAVKVQIPKTGLSVSDAQALLRDALGHETPVTGELVQDGDRISLTVRVGDRPGQTLYGASAELDLMLRRAAEQVLAQTEPYRYAIYLAAQNKPVEALAVAERLATEGSATDRAWGYAIWGRLLASAGDFSGASAKARRSLAFDPDIAASHDNLAAVERLLGHDAKALQAAEDTLAVMRRQERRLDEIGGPSRLAVVEGRVLEAQGDYGRAAARYQDAIRVGGQAYAGAAVASLPRVLAASHDIVGAREALDDLRGQLSEDALTDAALAPAFVAMHAEAWPEAERLLRKADMTATMFGPAGAAVRRTLIAPELARSQVMLGRVEQARATITPTPADCYNCARSRALIAGKAGARAEAERGFRAAVALAPALPGAYLDWARMRLAMGDARGALESARTAAELAPAWGEPHVVWGEALLRQGEPRAAEARFREAAELSPRWGLPLLRAGQAAAKQGRAEEARQLLRTARTLNLTRAQHAEAVAGLR